MSAISDNDIERMIRGLTIMGGQILPDGQGYVVGSAIAMLQSLRDERAKLAQDAARWLYVRRYMKLDDIGDEAFCLGLVIDSDALEHAVSDEASRLHEERRAAEWEDVRGPEDSPKDLPPVTLEEAVDAAMAGREEPYRCTAAERTALRNALRDSVEVVTGEREGEGLYNGTGRNQCDGCRLGYPMRGELHIDSRGRAYMACQKYRYGAGRSER